MKKLKIDIVITMGGVGSRFRKAGYTLPKYMIEAKGKTLFEWSLISLEGYRDVADRYIFVALKDEKADVEDFIRAECNKLSIENYSIILLDHVTDGQATSALKASQYWNPENPILIYNIDTYVEPGEMSPSDIKGDGHIPCFHAEGEHWSFVRLDDHGKAVEVREKKRISDNCTLGAYYFSSGALYSRIYQEYYGGNKNLENNEKYVAPLYNYMIEQGLEVTISNVDLRKVHVLGTPNELESFINE